MVPTRAGKCECNFDFRRKNMRFLTYCNTWSSKNAEIAARGRPSMNSHFELYCKFGMAHSGAAMLMLKLNADSIK